MGSVHDPRGHPGATADDAAAPQVLLAQPRGFCAGVVRAVEIVERALELHGAPVYVFHEIVHNGHVVADLRARGAVFVDTLGEVPSGAVTVFSAHGVALAVERDAMARGLRVIDATCPLVGKVHLQAQRYVRQGHALVVIGHAGHEEVVGTMGRVDAEVHLVSRPEDVAALRFVSGPPVAYVTQTTLSVDDTRDIIQALKARFPQIVGPDLDDICYATQNRQNAVRALARQVDLLLIVGSANSSNAQRLREVAEQQGVAAYLVPDETGVDPSWLDGVQQVGVSAGASTPEVLVQRVARRLSALGAGDVRQLPGVEESVAFRLPLAVLRPAA
ncbi:4-hydroxy-3-methylbut-2-enyl diphosphate reductase [Rubrivivax albus]|uniref:4-hydroxy-3-methylbut-2-enyl diphosphate reductase n=1 Tax=Rubrivivax albus TaxID=2499835 RepID=A0A3S2U817_9BURK|nr:4-hydroxy-3-methylbut-2-enyl diphosphate reductase [Rubrivivax albus]